MATKKSDGAENEDGPPRTGAAAPEAGEGPAQSEPAASESIDPPEPPQPAATPLAASAPERETPRADPAPKASAEPGPPVFTRLEEPAPTTAAGPAPTTAARPASAPEHREQKRGRSFAGVALTWLVLLLGGAALGVWAAPKVAPMLPAGLAPVSAWLTPGLSATETRIAALEAELAAVTAQVSAAPTAADLEASAGGLVEAARSDLAGQIAGIEQTLAQSDFTSATERIGRLESGLDGAVAELGSIRDQLAAGAASNLSAEAVASIDTYRAELDGLRAEVGQLSGQVSGLGGRLDEAVASAEARVTEAQTEAEQVQTTAAAERDLAAAQAQVALIRAALASGAPFQEPLDALAASGVAPPAGLAAAAAGGVATPALLQQQFADDAHRAIRASLTAAAGEGVLGRTQAFLQSQVASRSLTPQEGGTPDAVLSRIEDSLRAGDLNAALAEAGQLPSEAAAAMSGWLAAAETRAAAEAGLAEVSASVATTN